MTRWLPALALLSLQGAFAARQTSLDLDTVGGFECGREVFNPALSKPPNREPKQDAVATPLKPVEGGEQQVAMKDDDEIFEDDVFDPEALLEVGRHKERQTLQPSTLQEYFDDLRTKYGVLTSDAGYLDGGLADAGQCTKKDICLLMRQLDLDFYKRARAGLLRDADYNIPATALWLKSGNCLAQEQVRGFKMRAVLDMALCRRRVRARGIAALEQVESQELPRGCVISSTGKGNARAFLNTAETTKGAGVAYKGTKKLKTMVLCEMDRSLEDSAASYYSPYKLPPGQVGREAHSRSCSSYGMFSFLAKLRETKSSCAKILTYRLHPKFRNLKKALDLAVALEAQGDTAGATLLRAYVQSLRQKFTLIGTVITKWCPSIWSSAQATPGGTCDVPRFPTWAMDGSAKQQSQTVAVGGGPAQGAKVGGRLGAAIALHGDLPMVGNQILLDQITALVSALKVEETTPNQAANGKDDDVSSSQGQPEEQDNFAAVDREKREKPVKLALTPEACTAFDDESLADVMEDESEVLTEFLGESE